MRRRRQNVERLGLVLAVLFIVQCQGRRSPLEERARQARGGSGDVVLAAVWSWDRRKEVRFGDGLQMALDEVNAEGGIRGRRLRIARYDDGESLDEGTLLAQRIAADPQIVAVIGHLQSYVTTPVAPLYDAAGLLLMAPTSTDPALTRQGLHRVFQAAFTDRDTGRQLAEFASKRFRRAGIFYIRNSYGRGLANAFEERANELGLGTAARRSYDPSEELNGYTFTPTLREWASLDLDVIFLAGEVPSAAQFVANARAAGLTVPILGGDAMSSPALMAVAGRAAEGVIVTTHFHPDEPRPEVLRFSRAFTRRFGGKPDAGAALGYDVVRVLARAMGAAERLGADEVARALRDLPPWPGVTGMLKFDQQGATIGKRPVMTVVRDGRFQYLPEDLSDGARASTVSPPPGDPSDGTPPVPARRGRIDESLQ
jgi:branched-chain amino acid transport system substrate-binding protein